MKPGWSPVWRQPLLRVFSSIPALVSLAILGILLLGGLEWFDPFYFTYDDNATQNLGWFLHNYRTLACNGELAFINTHQFLGNPHFLISPAGVLYLPGYLAGWIADIGMGSPAALIDVNSCLHLFAALFATYAFLRLLRISPATSVYGALLHCTCPFILTGAKAEIVIPYCAFYFPALLACLEAYLQTRAARYLVLSTGLKVFFIFQGNVQFYFMYMVAEVIYGFFRKSWKRPDRWRLINSWLFSNALAIALSLPLLMPLQWAVHQSTYRSTASMDLSLAQALHASIWLKAQFFQFQPEVIFKSASSLFFLGGMLALPWLLIRTAMSRIDRRWVTVVVLLAISLLFSTRANSILLWFPPFSFTRWPYKWYQLADLSFAATYALSLHFLVVNHRLRARWAHLFFVAAITSNLLVALSPIGQKPFADYHVTTESAKSIAAGPRWTGGRILPCLTHSFDSNDELVELRTFNFPTVFGEDGFAGYDPLTNASSEMATMGLNYNATLPMPMTQEYLNYASLWGVRYLITGTPSEAGNLSKLRGLRLADTTESGLAVFENTAAAPFAWLERDGSALPIQFKGNSAQINLKGRSGTVIVSLVCLRGWTYSIDGGKWLPPESTELRQMRLYAPPESGTITLTYFPPVLKGALRTSTLLTLMLVPLWTAFERQGPSMSMFLGDKARRFRPRFFQCLLVGSLLLWLWLFLGWSSRLWDEFHQPAVPKKIIIYGYENVP